ncbi:type II and III secretion system protein family protein [Vibrio sp. RC27]
MKFRSSSVAKCLLALVTLVVSISVRAQVVLNLAEGQAQAISVNSNIGSVFIADPNVADYQVIDREKIVVFGKTVGSTTVMVFDEEGQTLVQKTLVVNTSLVHIQQQIQLRYPNADVVIYNLGAQAVLSGVVPTEKEKQEIEEIVGELLHKESTDTAIQWDLGDDKYTMDFMTKRDFKGLVNNIEVVTTKQVNVKLTVAEVSHSFLEEFGLEIGSTSAGIFTDYLTSFSASDIVSVISAVSDDSVGEVLAQPNLSVISGETASFLVGGELPVITVVDGSTSISYKEYGIRLELMAKVVNDQQIKLSLMPEVSSLDETYSSDTYDIPALKSRKARTTVELGDGQSFVLGGLLSSEETESLSKIPFAGDIPVLGALFRHTESERYKTELIIIATVNLVGAVETNKIQLPTMERSSTLERFFGWTTKNSEQYPARNVLRQGGFIE